MSIKSKSSPAIILPLMITGLFLVIIFSYHLGAAALGYSNYRDQHIGSALVYAKGQINLLAPVIIGFNATGTPTPLELPLWQAITAGFFKIFGPWFGWANLVSLLLFSTILWPLFQLVRSNTDRNIAAWTLVFFCAQPLILEQAGRGGADGLCITVAIWFLYATDKLITNKRWIWLVAAAILGALTAVLKLPFFMATGIAVIGILWQKNGFHLTSWVKLGVVGAFGAICFLIWTKYCDTVLANAVFPFVELRVSQNPDMVWWYFGDWAYRLNPANWIRAGWRALNGLYGSFVLAGITLAGFGVARRGIAHWLLLGGLITTLIFSHLVLHHRNYFLMFSPAIAIFSAIGLVKLEQIIPWQAIWQKRVFAVGTASILFLALIQGWIGMEMVMQFDPYRKQIAAQIAANTNPSDKLLIVGGGWGGDQLILSKRQGLSIWNAKFLEDPQILGKLKELGYNRLVLISQSPLLHSLMVTNPGGGTQKREVYQTALSPIAQDWPIVIENADIQIRKIP